MQASLYDARLKLRHLHAFAAVARERTVQRAADALSLTASAVSKALQELEAIVGHPLFRRTRKGLIATVEGEQLLRHVVPGLGLLRDGLNLASGRQDDTGTYQVRLGILPTVASAVAPLAVAQMQARHERTDIQVVSGTNAALLNLLRDGELDLVVGRLPDTTLMLNISFEPLYSEQMVLVSAPAHPLAGKAEVVAADLLAYPLVLPLGDTIVRRSVDTFFLAAGVGAIPRITQTLFESFGTPLVQLSDAVWFTPVGSVRRHLEAGKLARLRIDTSSTAGTIGLSLRAGAELTAAAAAMAEALRAQAARWREAAALLDLAQTGSR